MIIPTEEHRKPGPGPKKSQYKFVQQGGEIRRHPPPLLHNLCSGFYLSNKKPPKAVFCFEVDSLVFRKVFKN